MKNLGLLMFLLAAGAMGATYTSSQNGNWSDAATWGGGGVPGDGDIATVSHSVTMNTNVTLGTAGATGVDELTISAGTLTIARACTLSMKRDIYITGGSTLSMLPKSAIVFSDDYRIRYNAASNVVSIQGVADSVATITAATGKYWILRRTSGSSGCHFDINYAHFISVGNSSNDGLEILNDYDVAGAKSFIMKNSLMKNYGTFEFSGVYDNTDSVVIDSCAFINPLGTYAFLHNITRERDAGYSRIVKNSTFYNNNASSLKDVRMRGPTGAQTRTAITFENVVTWNVRWDVGTECLINKTAIRTNGTASTIVLIQMPSGKTATFKNSIVAGHTYYNSHLIGGASEGTQTLDSCYTEDMYNGAGGEADNFLSGTATTTYNISNHIAINGSMATFLTAANLTYNLNRVTLVEQLATKAPIFTFETNNPTGGSRTVKSSVFFTRSNDYFAQSAVSGGSDTMLSYSDYNAWYGRTVAEDGYSDVTVAGLTFGDSGWDAHSVTANPQFNNDSANIGTWDSVNGGGGSQANAFNEMIKLAGYDTSGTATSFAQKYSIDSLLSYVRTAYTPTNDSLDGTGFGGVDIGAMDYVPAAVPNLSITTHPVSDTITVGDTATFWVVATGGTLAYQWQVKPDAGAWTDTNSTTDTLLLAGSNGDSVRVIVSDEDETDTSNVAHLTVNAAPATITITAVDSVSHYGGSVLITGSAMGDTGTLVIDGDTVATTAWYPDSARFNRSLGDTGTFQLIVVDTGGLSDTADFRGYLGLALDSVGPDTLPHIAGVGKAYGTFGTTAGSVTVGPDAATVTAWTSDSITFTCPTFATAGNRAVEITDAQGYTVNSDADSIYFYLIPAVASVQPSHNSYLGDDTIAIDGQYFGDSTASSAVMLGDSTTTLLGWTDSTVFLVNKAGTGTVDVIVTGSDGFSDTLVNGFTYDPKPVVDSISPPGGSRKLNTVVTIYGTGFLADNGDGYASIEDADSVILDAVWSDTLITGTALTGTAGAQPVIVFNTNGDGDTLADAFTFDSIPVIQSISPAKGPVEGGTTVTLTGVDFEADQGDGTVTFGGVEASYTSWADGSLVVVTPAGTGTVEVILTTTGTLADTTYYTYSSTNYLTHKNLNWLKGWANFSRRLLRRQ